MAKENVKKFFDEVPKAAGFDFTAEELFEASDSGDEKLSLDDLDAVVGGGQISYSIFSGGSSGVMSASTKKSEVKREVKYFS